MTYKPTPEEIEAAWIAVKAEGTKIEAGGTTRVIETILTAAAAQRSEHTEVRGDGWRPIETAPKDREILVYARWDWDDMDRPSEEYNTRVCKYYVNVYGKSTFLSVSDNPYSDSAYEPTHWQPLPAAPTATEPPKE